MAHAAERGGRAAAVDGGASLAPGTIGRRAAEVVDDQRRLLAENLGSALDGRDPEGVHDMRVASRRLRACLQTFAPWCDAGELRRVEAGVREVTRALGRVRELDVMRLRIAGLARRSRPERALALEALDARLERRRRRARARMMARFAKVDLDRLDHRLRRLASHLEAAGAPREAASPAASRANGATAGGHPPLPNGAANGGGHAAAATATAGHAPASADVAQLVAIAATDVLGAVSAIVDREIPAAIGAPEAAEEIHQVRIAAKKLRYLLEILAPTLGAAGTRLVKDLKGLQDRLGDFHDDSVLDEALRAMIARSAERDRKLLASELRRFRSLRRRALAREERAVRAAIASLRERDFAGEVASALAAAGASTGTAAAAAAAETSR